MTLNYMAIPSLQNAVAVAVVGQVWKQLEVRNQITFHRDCIRRGEGYSGKNERYRDIKTRVSALIFSLPNPDIINAKLSLLITSMGFKILQWIEDLEEETKCNIRAEHLNAIVWTMRGTINETETFKSLSGFSPSILYKLACKFCIHDYVIQLWSDLEEKDKKYFTNKFRLNCWYLISFWTNIVKGKSNTKEEAAQTFPTGSYEHRKSVNVNILKLSLKRGHFNAMMHFWSKLTKEEISANIFDFLNTAVGDSEVSKKCGYLEPTPYSNIIFFLLSQVDDESKIELIQKFDEKILRLMLDCPWQTFFTPTINLVWNVLSNETFLSLAERFLRYISEKSMYEIIFFEDFWNSTPTSFKNFFLKNLVKNPSVIYDFFKFEDLKIVKLLLKDIELKDRVRVINRCIERSIELLQLVYDEKYFLLDTLFIEMSLKSFIAQLRRKIMLTHASSLCSAWLKNGEWSSVEAFLKWITQSADDIINFKKRVIDIKLIAKSLIIDCKYDVLDVFLKWCLLSDNQIATFKGEFSGNYTSLLTLGLKDWSSFEMFINWCFNAKDLKIFKQGVLTLNPMLYFVFDLIIVTTYNFEFAHELILWKYDSEIDVINFKEKFILHSHFGLVLFERLLSNCAFHDSVHNNWTLMRKYTQWCYPMSKTAIQKLKEIFTNNFRLYFHEQKCGVNYNPKSQQAALFYLLDKFALNKEGCNIDVDTMNNGAEVLLGGSLDEDSDSCDARCNEVYDILATITDSDENGRCII